MKLLQVINSVDSAGGGTIEGVIQLGRAMSLAGHSVEIASLDAPNAECVKPFPLPVYALGPSLLKYGFSTLFIPWLRANRTQYDAVIVNGMWQFHSFGTWRALSNSETPYFVFTHGMLDPWFKREYPLKHFKKWMYWPWAEYRVLRDARAVLFTCDEELRLARDSFWLYRCNQVVVGLGTGRPKGDAESEVEEFVARYPELRGKKLVLFMGRIHPKKGCDLLIEAFAAVLGSRPEWHLVMAGPDQLGWQKKLSHQASKVGLESRITWSGMISGAMKWGALRAAEIFVLPSHQENFGIAAIEALAVGLPVLISKRVNIWREIECAGAGLASQDSFEGVCRLLQTYAEMPTERRLSMRLAAIACFERKFEITTAARTLQRVLAGQSVC